MKNKSFIISCGSIVAGFLLSVGIAVAAPNPAGTGQPGASCEVSTVKPNGFLSGGFANAETHYAGSAGTSRIVSFCVRKTSAQKSIRLNRADLTRCPRLSRACRIRRGYRDSDGKQETRNDTTTRNDK